MSSLSATQSDGYYLPPEYFESGAYKRVSRNRYAAETQAKSGKGTNGTKHQKVNVGHNQWLKHGVVRFELPEKAVCLGSCRQSVGRGTRFNARKIKTEETYFTTPIFEFQLKCRNCQEPWVIRTDPKERGFAYISGVKRQAGQDRNLVEESLGTIAADVDGPSAAYNGKRRNSLDRLEAAAVTKLRRNPNSADGVSFRTEIEELEALVKLNASASGDGRDVDHNTSIRKTFRKDRRDHRKTLVGGKDLGWRSGMALLPPSSTDILGAKETCYGKAHRDERSKLFKVRTSSIFDSTRGGKRKRDRKRYDRVRIKQEDLSGNSISDKNENNHPAVSGGELGNNDHSKLSNAALQTPIETPEHTASSSTPVTIAGAASFPRKTFMARSTLRLSNGVVSIVDRGTFRDKHESEAAAALFSSSATKSGNTGTIANSNVSAKSSPPKEKRLSLSSASSTNNNNNKNSRSNLQTAQEPLKPSLLDLVGTYGSSEDEDEGG